VEVLHYIFTEQLQSGKHAVIDYLQTKDEFLCCWVKW